MKTLVTGLFALGLTIQSFAQTSSKPINEVNIDNLVLSSPKNVSYVNTVNNKTTTGYVQKLETEAGNYDITKTSVFNENSFDTYEVLFNNVEGEIIATYDHQGKLVNAFEKFKKSPLPENVSNAIHNKYPGWTIHSTVYRVNYYNDNKVTKDTQVTKVYNVQIMNNDKKMNLKVTSEGKILKHSDKK